VPVAQLTKLLKKNKNRKNVNKSLIMLIKRVYFSCKNRLFFVTYAL